VAAIIIDSGPLVALIDQAEQHHAWSKESLTLIQSPLLTCEAVLSEACFLLASVHEAYSHLAVLIEKNIVVPVSMSGFHLRIFELMEKYHSLPMSFADACLVCMVENNPNSVLFTLDRDFTVYRQQRRRIIPLIAPFSS
jgi:uncharacterized protein